MTHLILIAALAFQESVTKDEIIRLTKDGAKETEILARIGGAKFKLSVDEIVDLKKAGVAEKVLARMIEGPSEAKVTNLAHKAVTIRVIGSTIDVGWEGETVQRGKTLLLPISGEYAVKANGRATACTVKTPATLTFRGCDLGDLEVITLYIEDARGSDTCRVETQIRR